MAEAMEGRAIWERAERTMANRIGGITMRSPPIPRNAERTRTITFSSDIRFDEAGVPQFRNVSFNYGYMSESGKFRSLLAGPMEPERGALDLDQLIFDYDWAIAIDTNREMIGDEEVCVTAAVVLQRRRVGQRVVGFGRTAVLTEMRNPTKDFEKVGWAATIQAIRRDERLSAAQRIVVITDHGERLLPALNDRSAQLADGTLLPSNITMMKASDRASDSIANQMIKHAHDVASDVLGLIKRGVDPGEPFTTVPKNGLCARYRSWLAYARPDDGVPKS